MTTKESLKNPYFTRKTLQKREAVNKTTNRTKNSCAGHPDAFIQKRPTDSSNTQTLGYDYSSIKRKVENSRCSDSSRVNISYPDHPDTISLVNSTKPSYKQVINSVYN